MQQTSTSPQIVFNVVVAKNPVANSTEVHIRPATSATKQVCAGLSLQLSQALNERLLAVQAPLNARMLAQDIGPAVLKVLGPGAGLVNVSIDPISAQSQLVGSWSFAFENL